MNEVTAPVEAENTQDVSDADVDAFFESGGLLPSEDQEQESENVESEQETEVREQDEAQGDEAPLESGADEAKAEEKEQKTVPYGALHEERQMRKEARAEAAELREKMARMEERFAMLQEAMQPQEPEVSFEDDPAGYLRKQAEDTKKALEGLTEQQKQQQLAQQEQSEYNNFISAYQRSASEYAEENPQFNDAYQYLVEGRIKEHEIAGLSRDQAVEVAQREERAIVRMAFDQGVNPAERLVEMAKVRGWSAVIDSNKEVDKVAQVEKGQQAAKTISKGGAAESKLTLESLADMEGAEFDKAWKKLFGAD